MPDATPTQPDQTPSTEPTVEMNIPVDEPHTGLPVSEIPTSPTEPTETATPPSDTPAEPSGEIVTAGVTETLVDTVDPNTQSNPQTEQPTETQEQPQNQELSTEDPQLPTDIQEPVVLDNIAPVDLPSPAVPGAGRKCDYCENKDKYQSLADEYVDKAAAKTGDKVAIPFIEELAVILKKDEDTIGNWSKKKIKDAEGNETDELEHPEWAATIKRLTTIQKLRLQQRVLGRFNPTGAIFLLKVNHDLIETEKKVISGDSKEPLVIEFIGEKPELPAHETTQ